MEFALSSEVNRSAGVACVWLRTNTTTNTHQSCGRLTLGAKKWEDWLTTHLGNEPAKSERKKVEHEEGLNIFFNTRHVIQDQSKA